MFCLDEPFWLARRRYTALLGLFLLTANLVVGTILPQTSLSNILNVDPAHYVVCTGAGMIEFDENGKQLPAGETAFGSEICVFCLPLMQSAVAAPAFFAVVEADRLASGTDFPSLTSAELSSVNRSGAPGPRAPPII